MHTKVIKCNRSYNRSQLQYSIKTLAIKILHKKVDNCGTKKIVKCSNANKSYQLQYCKQKLSLATCAHKSYRSFDAILRFLPSSAPSPNPNLGAVLVLFSKSPAGRQAGRPAPGIVLFSYKEASSSYTYKTNVVSLS